MPLDFTMPQTFPPSTSIGREMFVFLTFSGIVETEAFAIASTRRH
jgi:hypothetical protein